MRRHDELRTVLLLLLLFLLRAVSPPLPPPPSSDVDDRFTLLQSRAFDPRYSAVASANMPYVDDYGRDGYAGRRSQIEEEEEAWVPENYLEKGRHLNDILLDFVIVMFRYLKLQIDSNA